MKVLILGGSHFARALVEPFALVAPPAPTGRKGSCARTINEVFATH